jgi:hypothetical protein
LAVFANEIHRRGSPAIQKPVSPTFRCRPVLDSHYESPRRSISGTISAARLPPSA